ncbi:hypothetical protein F511_11402 [Dorcoceras hygrometricum]|uniref:Uncharacterized protein n=1 Tax=Dorcoceras hygrometricum TaxID=472368 RepID=A0A2Z7AC40_9LAMI|nr:hypothetical protein F511_11402 [Dorcoceras hygrometricum]
MGWYILWARSIVANPKAMVYELIEIQIGGRLLSCKLTLLLFRDTESTPSGTAESIDRSIGRYK